MARKKKQYDDDDGRVIADMNVEGMPWYNPGHTTSQYGEADDKNSNDEQHNALEKLTPKETFWLYFGAMKAGCLVAFCAAVIITIAGLLAYFLLGGLFK